MPRANAAPLQPARITVSGAHRHALSPLHYSLFLETELNFGGEGGLLAQLVRNHDFEALGRGNLGEGWEAAIEAIRRNHDSGIAAGLTLDPQEPAPTETDHRPWRAAGGAQLRVIARGGPSARNPHHLHVRAEPGGGASNPGYWGIGVRPGVPLRLSLHARTAQPAGNGTGDGGGGASWRRWFAGGPAPLELSARLVAGSHDGDGSTARVPLATASIRVARGGGWAQYTAELTSRRGASDARLELVLPGGGELWLDHVSLVPSDAVGGLFRRDVFESIAALRPGFVRMPGGNYLEGFGPRTRWDWKATLGAPRDRPGHYNSAWKSWVARARAGAGAGAARHARVCGVGVARCLGRRARARELPHDLRPRVAREWGC